MRGQPAQLRHRSAERIARAGKRLVDEREDLVLQIKVPKPVLRIKPAELFIGGPIGPYSPGVNGQTTKQRRVACCP